MAIPKAKLFRLSIVVILIGLFGMLAKPASAQYFVSESNPIIKWSKIEFDNQYIVFPRSNPNIGLTVSQYMELLRTPITTGLNPNLSKFPVLINTQNILSNGMVTWTPSRMELYGVPSRNTFATQWLKQLTTHEFRHVAQLSALDVGFTKGLSYVLGQQSQGLISALLRTYYLEGDAVLTETLYSTFGRGRQPEFSIGHRALMDVDSPLYNKKNRIKYNQISLGSLKNFSPDIYATGYYLVSSVDRRLGGDFWGKALRYTGRNPFFLFTFDISFKKYAKTTFSDEFELALNDLKAHWKQFSDVEDSATAIKTRTTSYSTYTYPLPLNDTLIVSLKKDLDRTNRFVTINPKTGEEEVLFYTGYVTSRPIIKDNTLYWTEYAPSLSWGNKNSSVVKSAKLKLDKNNKITDTDHSKYKINEQGVFYVTALGDRGFAMISYNDASSLELIITDTEFNIKSRHVQDWFDASFNGLAWDNKTEKLLGIILNEDGMWLGQFNDTTKTFDKFSKPSYVTLNNLSASDGKALFSSISSGKDEVHIMDLVTKEESRLTESKYGSVASSLGSIWSQRTTMDSTFLLTKYSIEGYLPATQKLDTVAKEKIEYRFIPKDFLSYKYDSVKLARETVGEIINMDTVKIDKSQLKNFKIEKYSKAKNLFRIHSWAPFYISVPRITNESEIAIGAGANMLSQNLLSDFVAMASVGYYKKTIATSATLKYTGLPVHINATVDYGGGYQNTIKYDEESSRTIQPDKYLNISAGLSLPLNLSSGVNNRYLTLSTDFSYINSLVQTEDGYDEGIEKLSFNASYSSFKSRTIKEMNPRLGYVAQFYSSFNPFRNDFGTVYGVMGRGYLPGFMLDHSLQLAASYQFQDEKKYNYSQKGLFPMGAYSNFSAKSISSVQAKYQAPLFYPDWGMGPLIYFKRISLNVIGDYSNVEATQYYKSAAVLPEHFYTYGAGLDFLVHLFSFGTPLTFGFTLYKTNTYDSMGVGFNFGIDF